MELNMTVISPSLQHLDFLALVIRNRVTTDFYETD